MPYLYWNSREDLAMKSPMLQKLYYFANGTLCLCTGAIARVSDIILLIYKGTLLLTAYLSIASEPVSRRKHQEVVKRTPKSASIESMSSRRSNCGVSRNSSSRPRSLP